MTHEFFEASWTTSVAPPLVRDSTVRFASAAPMPGAAAGETGVLVTVTDDRVFHVGDLVALRKEGAADVLIRLVGDLAVDALNRWTATGRAG